MDWELWIHGYAKNWHDAFEILGALGSTAAAIVAVWLASRERVDRKIAENDRDVARAAQLEAEQADARRERETQARKISVRSQSFGRNASVLEFPSRIQVVEQVVATNYSDMPLTYVAVGYFDETGTMNPLETETFLAPGDSVIGNLEARDYLDERRIRPDSEFVLFRDLAGNVWLRRADGTLAPATITDSEDTGVSSP